ncbi:MAG: hypothetical protein JWP04_2886 [Belnapia sp.]|nr:hypothetical protein [Belnapia sp.]
MPWTSIAVATALGLLVALPAAGAERRERSPAQLAQQAKMRSCAADARGQQLHGAPRRDFMKTCLSGRNPRPA